MKIAGFIGSLLRAIATAWGRLGHKSGCGASPTPPYLNEPGANDGLIWTGFDSQVAGAAGMPPFMRDKFAVTTTELSARTLVLIVAGQSIAANYAAYNPVPANIVELLNPYDRTVYAINGNAQTGWAPDGVTSYSSANMGASGYFDYSGSIYGGSWITRLADLLMSSGLKSGPISRVIIVNVAIGSSSIGMWSSGDLFQRLAAAWWHCAALGWTKSRHFVPAILWCQGEADTILATPADAYVSSFNAMVSKMTAIGCNAPWFVPIETISSGCPSHAAAANSAIRQAQASARTTKTIPPVFGSDQCDFDICAPSRRADDGTHPDAISGPQMAEMVHALIASNL